MHAMFQDHQTSGSGEENIKAFYHKYMGMVAIMVIVTWTIYMYMNFIPHFQWMLHMKLGFDWPSGFREEDF